MNPTNLAQQLAVIETTSGLDLLVDYVSWIEFDGLPVVVTKSGKRKSVLKKYQRVYKVLSAHKVHTAIREAKLSFSVILELGSAVYPLRKRKDRTTLLITLCEALTGLDTDEALRVMRDMIATWVGDTTKRPDVAYMHTHVGNDGKHRLTTAFNTPIAARIDTILHRLAEHIKRDNPTLQYDQAYTQTLIYKLTTYHHGGLTTGINLAPLCKHHNGKNDDNPDQHPQRTHRTRPTNRQARTTPPPTPTTRIHQPPP